MVIKVTLLTIVIMAIMVIRAQLVVSCSISEGFGSAIKKILVAGGFGSGRCVEILKWIFPDMSGCSKLSTRWFSKLNWVGSGIGKMLGRGPVSNTRWALMVIIKYWEVSQQVVTAAANFWFIHFHDNFHPLSYLFRRVWSWLVFVSFLAVQDSSIGDLTHSLTHLLTQLPFDFCNGVAAVVPQFVSSTNYFQIVRP